MERNDSHSYDSAAAAAKEYYLSVADENTQGSFHCLDDPSNLDFLISKVQNTSTGNYVVDFSDDTAWAGFDLSAHSLEALFDSVRPEALGTRWINIWSPFQHRPMLELLAQRYDFSPRLFALMCSDPRLSKGLSQSTICQSVRKRRVLSYKLPRCETMNAETQRDEISEHSSIASSDSVQLGNIYSIVDNIWHYSSVDLGRQYVCIGYNSLYGTKGACEDVSDPSSPLPQCKRVWTWTLLCEDNTVITINEDPFPFVNGMFTFSQKLILNEVRRNLVNVFRSLCTLPEEPLAVQNPMLLLPIRVRLGKTPEETAHRDSDTPGLLFYYLFENWHNSYTLVTRKESRYGVELSNLRSEMLHLPKLEHIERLDRIGKELGVLRRHYQAYIRIIDRLLAPPLPTSIASLQNSQIVTQSSQASLNTIRPLVTERASQMGVSLSSAAKVRFQRLCDLIDLYALSEVEDYIQQKEAMVSMNFSLIAIKQSVDVDKLTRITLLLTKATILFLPASLATSYFSTQLEGTEYTVRTYWVTFGSILFMSWLALFLFGLFNGSVQTSEVVKGFVRGMNVGRMWVTSKTSGIGGSKV